MRVFYFLAFLFLVSARTYYTVHYSFQDNSYSLSEGKNTSGVAWGWFDLEVLKTTGWTEFSVETTKSSLYNNSVRAFAAGFLEGALTSPLILPYLQTFEDIYTFYFKQNPGLKEKLYGWFADWVSYVQEKIEKPEDDYWEHVSLIFAQIQGMVDGYNRAIPNQNVTFLDFILTNSQTDAADVVNVLLPPDQRIDWTAFPTPIDLYRSSARRTHCSAIIRLVQEGANSELFTSHTTWNGFVWMLRIFKYYDISFQGINLASRKCSFSSYPTFISSTDDYYLNIETKLAVQETTFSIYNTTLYDVLKPTGCLMSWVRVVLANRMASTGPQWVQIFARENSGTYNNQWMIVDYKQFDAKTGNIGNDTLWILEQLPGMIETGDMTRYLLGQGYWPSYNIPYFHNLFVLAGYAKIRGIYGPLFSYQTSPRAMIFRTFVEEKKAQTLDDLKFLMQYNDYKNNPVGLRNPIFAISSRLDLLEDDPFPFGGYDSKLTSASLFDESTCVATSGPTQQQPVFSWSNPEWAGYSHWGQPTTWDFDWVTMKMS